MPQLLPAAAAWAAAAWSSAVTATAVGLTHVGVMAAIGEGATIALAGKLVAAGATLALSAAATAMMRPNTPSSGTTLDFKPDPKAPVRGAMGYTAVGGNKAFQATWGYNRVALSLGIALSLGPIDAVARFEADGSVVSFTGAQNEATGFYAKDMWQKTTLGLPGDAALLPPTGFKYGNPGLTGWGAQHAAPQVAFGFWTMLLAKNPEDRDVFTNGVPDPRWVLRGMKVWDPRKDSTYPGGNGSQRRNDWRTWGFNENAWIHAIAWLRGHHKLNLDGTIDRTKRIAGVGAPDAAIDLAIYVEGANVADANGWTISGEWSTGDGKWQTLASILQAGGGRMINRGSQISALINAPRVSTYTYTKADLIGQAQIKPLTPRRDRKNTIIPRYRSEAHNWEYVAAGEVTAQTYRDEDRGEPRSSEVQYTLVRDPKQAGQLAAYDLANLREGLSATLPSKAYMQHVHAGDCITINEPELALVGQKVIVMRAGGDYKSATWTLEVQSETDAKHAWALGQTNQGPSSPTVSAVDPKTMPPPVSEDWSVVPKPPSEGGVSQPIFAIELPIETSDIVGVIIKHGPSAEGPWTDGYEGSPRSDGRYEVTGLNPGQAYCVSLQYVAKNGTKSDPDIKCGIVAGDLISGDTTHLNGTPVTEITDRLQSVEAVAARTLQGVADLEEVFGDTVSAAESALAAGEAANLAVLKAGDASAAAAASNVSAGIASTKADEAGNSATAANVAKVAAEAARDVAGGQATASATSAANAAASATTAGEKAAASDASATQAATRAGEALTYRNQSSSSATDAGTAAANAVAASITAGTSATTAQSVANRIIPDRLAVAADFTLNGSGTPNSRPDLSTGTVVVVTNEGDVREIVSSAVVFSKGWLAIGTGRTFRVAVRSRVTVNGGAATATGATLSVLDASGVALTSLGTATTQTVASGWQVTTYESTSEQILVVAPTAAYIRARGAFNRTAANASSGATTQVAFMELLDVTTVTAAATSAATAVAQASLASASAASASISANLAASVGTGSLNKNATFAIWPSGQSTPDNIGSFGSGLTVSRGIGKVSPNSIIIEAAAGSSNNGVEVAYTAANWNGRMPVVAGAPAYWVIDYKIEIGTGGLNGPMLRFLLTNAATGASLGSVIQKPLSDLHTSTGDDQIIEGAYFFRCDLPAASPPASARLALFARAGAVANYNRIIAHKLAVRPATSAEIAAGVALPAVQAQLSITAAVAADAATRLASVRFDVTGGAGGDPFQIWARADASGSAAGLVATELSFASVVGGVVVKAMKIIGGEVFYMRPIYIDVGSLRLIVGPGGTWVLWFGGNDKNAATATRTNGVFCLGTDGKVYYGANELAGGAKSGGRTFQSGAGGSVAETTVGGIAAGSFIEMTGTIDGGSLSANASQTGNIALFEIDGSGSRQVYAEIVTIDSTGLQLPNGSWTATSASIASIRVPAQKTGSVTYRAQFTRLSGSSYVNGAVLSGSVFITPPA